MSEHDEIGELLPGYALGCLDAEDEAAARAHLAECACCREELASLRGIVGDLAAALPASAPPAGLEDRLLAAAKADVPEILERGLPLRAVAKAGARGRAGASARRFLALAATAAILVLGAGNVLQWQGSHAKGLTTIAFSGRGASAAAFGTIVLDADDNEGVLAVRGLPALEASRRYQFWLAKGGLRAAGGLFAVDARGYGSLILDVPPELRGFDAFLVTVEPAAGSPAPTGASVMEGRR